MTQQLSKKRVVFFISTGRCGTQFFADQLAANYSDLATVVHEPFHQQYTPLRHFDAYHRGKSAELTSHVERHIDFIKETLKSKHYIETGWPAYGVLPHLIATFADRVQLVHLYRHPLRVAASLTTHNVYSRAGWSEWMSISPAQYGVVQDHLTGEPWNRLSEFEKCLFWWTELNHYAIRLQESFPAVPWLSLRFEDIFSDDGTSELQKLVRYLDFPEKDGFVHSLQQKTDRFSSKTVKQLNVDAIANYPAAVQMMNRLGYDATESVSQEIATRYKMG